MTNYPVQSWALGEIVSTSTPTYGVPLTIFAPATGDSCDFRILGGQDNSHVLQSGGCQDWTFSIPERDLQGPGTVFGQTSDVRVIAWTGDSIYPAWSDPSSGLVGAKYGEAYAVNLPDFVPGSTPASGYTSNLPAIFGGLQRAHTLQSGDPSSFELPPAVAGTTEGTCEFGMPPYVSPVVPGGCQDAIVVPGYTSTGTWIRGFHLELFDTDHRLLSYSDVELAYVDDMSALQVSAPGNAETGETTTIGASTDSGAPSSYEVVAEPESAGASSQSVIGTNAGAVVIASGNLDPSEESNGDEITVHHAFGSPGRYRLTATFTDVRGETTSGSTVITVTGLDTAAPTLSTPHHGFATGGTVSSGLTPVKFAWSGADAGGVGHYVAAISKDGGAYATISSSLTSPGLTRNLAGGHTYRLRVRAVDNSGNWSGWKYGPAFRVSVYQETSTSIIRKGGWSLASSPYYWGHGARHSGIAGAKAKVTFTGHSFAWVGAVGPTRGQAKIYVNGVYVKTVSLYAATTSYRRVLVSLSWSTATSRTVKIVVVGTTGHSRVDVDAFVTGS